MKKLILMLVVGVCMFASCEKENVNPNDPPSSVNTPVPFSLEVYIGDNGNPYVGYDFKVVVNSPTGSIDSLTTSFTNFTDGTVAPMYATLQCEVDTSLTYTLDVYDDNTGAFLISVPVDFYWEDYFLVNEESSNGSVDGELHNHDDLENQDASICHAVLEISI